MDTHQDPFIFTLESRTDRDERITLSSFGLAASGLADLMRRVTIEQSGAKPAIEWVINRLDIGSAILELDALPRSEHAPRVKRETADLVASGLERVERGEDPGDVFSPEVADAAREVLRVLSDSVGRVLIRSHGRLVELSREGAGRVAPTPGRFSSLGSVEGTVKTVSFSRERPFFSVYRSWDGRAVQCYFDERRFVDLVFDLLRQRARVMVVGRVGRRPDGSPFAVSDIREIRQLRGRADLPGVDDILGLDPELTEGLPGEEWLERQRA